MKIGDHLIRLTHRRVDGRKYQKMAQENEVRGTYPISRALDIYLSGT